jgi:hypothetical protein
MAAPEDLPGYAIAPEKPVGFSEKLDMPCSSWEKELGFSSEDYHAKRSNAWKHYSFGFTDQLDIFRPKILGYTLPSVLAWDPTPEMGMRHLLTLKSDEHWNWGDGHRIFFLIKDADLKATQFEHVAALDG